MRGLALDGRCLLRLDLARDADPEIVRLQVRNLVALARTNLPPQCAPEILPQADDALMLITLQPAANVKLADPSISLATHIIWRRLANVPGVARIQVVGAPEPQLRLILDPDKLRAFNLSVSEVVAAVQGSMKDLDDLTVLGHRLTVKKTEKLRDLGSIPLKPGQNIFLRDVASLKDTDEPREDAGISLRMDKVESTRRAVFFLVQLAPGKLNLLAKKGVEKTLKDVEKTLKDVESDLKTFKDLGSKVLCESRLLQANTTTVVMRLPDTADRLQRMEKVQAAAQAMLAIPQVRKVFWIAQPRSREAILYVLADPGNKADLHQALRVRLARIKGVSSRVGGLYSPFLPWPSEGAQLVVRLDGKDFEKLQQTAELLGKRLRNTAGIVDIEHFPRMGPVATVEVDREKAILSGVTTVDIVRALTAHADTIDLPIARQPWRLILEAPKVRGETRKPTIEELGNLPLASVNPQVNLLLRDVATVRLTSAPVGGIPHENGRPCVILFANVQDRTLEDARAAIKRLTQDLTGKGVRIEVE